MRRRSAIGIHMLHMLRARVHLLLELLRAGLRLQIGAIIRLHGSRRWGEANATSSGNLGAIGRLYLVSSNARICGLWPAGRNVLCRRHGGSIEVGMTRTIVRSVV